MADEVGKAIIVGTEKPTQLDMTNHMHGRRMIRSAKNPLDACTVVSIFPKEIIEVKETIEPRKFIIPAGSMEKPGVLVVRSASWWKDYDVTQPVLEITNGSMQVAESIVKDYCNGMLGCN